MRIWTHSLADSKAALGNVEEDLIKDFFLAKINNTSIQMECCPRSARWLNYYILHCLVRGDNKIKGKYYALTLPIGTRSMQHLNNKVPDHKYANMRTYNVKQTHKKSNHVGDVVHLSYKDTTTSAQQNKHNITSVQKCQKKKHLYKK